MYEPVRAHAEALRNLERTSCLLVVSTVPAVYNWFIASELRPSAGIHLRLQLEAHRSWRSWWVLARRRWVGGEQGKFSLGSSGSGGRTSVAGVSVARWEATAAAVRGRSAPVYKPAHLGGWRRPVRFGLWSQWLTCLQDSSCAQAWLGRRWHSGRPRPRPYGGARLEITSQPVSAVGVGAVGGG